MGESRRPGAPGRRGPASPLGRNAGRHAEPTARFPVTRCMKASTSTWSARRVEVLQTLFEREPVRVPGQRADLPVHAEGALDERGHVTRGQQSLPLAGPERLAYIWCARRHRGTRSRLPAASPAYRGSANPWG